MDVTDRLLICALILCLTAMIEILRRRIAKLMRRVDDLEQPGGSR